MTRMYTFCGILAALALAFGLSNWYSHHHGFTQGEAVGGAKVAALVAKYAEAQAKAEADARAQEQANAVAMAAIDAQHARELQHAKQDADAVIAGLRDGNLRLRREWAGCQAAAGVPETPAGSAESDAAAEQRSQGASDLVRIAAEADAQIRALQAIVAADRK